MNTEQQLTLEEFAEQVRRDCVDIMSRCAFGQPLEAGKLAAVLCQRAADIVQGAQMREELANGPDLASLEKYRGQPGIPE